MSKQAYPITTVPSSTSKTQQIRTGGFGRGAGTNVSDTLRGVNSVETPIIARIDLKARGRCKKYAAIRQTDEYKRMRQAAKRPKFIRDDDL